MLDGINSGCQLAAPAKNNMVKLMQLNNASKGTALHRFGNLAVVSKQSRCVAVVPCKPVAAPGS